ncbi:rRNA maturation RNase YbeY [Anaerococcus sp. NML200574]|uniref:rRNA maturation RNase YbeY n=1 Tax=Anaerococcus sp. NML200574 TaxID=2954486 RepID=UPI0022376344|nr:rRNA maturation RNase YbeY [Anaerococcus sp. NML200574]MCW6678890.1 rRNA maturation RNase YbeY [Anaerococcus sp. NML200574]
MNLLISNNSKEDLDLDQIEAMAYKTIEEVLRVEDFTSDVEVSLTLVDKDEIHTLNRDYRGVDRPTDVLSFPMDDEIFPGEEDVDLILGDIVICLDIAKAQAEEYGHSLDRELSYLICHSTLHLLGYDHMEDDEKAIMRGKEKEIMKNLGVFK